MKFDDWILKISVLTFDLILILESYEFFVKKFSSVSCTLNIKFSNMQIAKIHFNITSNFEKLTTSWSYILKKFDSNSID